ARDDERTAAARLLEPRELEDRRDRLLARAVDEGARVDDEALGVLGPGGQGKAGFGEHPEHQLGVDLILRTAEGREMNLHVGHISIPLLLVGGPGLWRDCRAPMPPTSHP